MLNFQENGAKYIHTEPSVLARFRYSSFGGYDNIRHWRPML